jgi:hypothetical protein
VRVAGPGSRSVHLVGPATGVNASVGGGKSAAADGARLLLPRWPHLKLDTPLQMRMFLGDPAHAAPTAAEMVITWPSTGKRRMDAVIKQLVDSRGVRTLTIRGEKRSVGEVDKIADWLKVAPPSLTKLTIDKIACQDAAMVALAEAVAINTNLTSLRLPYPFAFHDYSHRQKADQDQSQQAALLLCQVVSNNTCLTDLPSWCLETAGMASHAEARIHLGRNRGMLLCSSLRSMFPVDLQKLKKLDLRAYMLGDQGVGVVASFLTSLTSLATLDVRENCLTSKGVKELCSSLLAQPLCRIQSLLLTGDKHAVEDSSGIDDEEDIQRRAPGSHAHGGMWDEASVRSWSGGHSLCNVIGGASVSLADMLQVGTRQGHTGLLTTAAKPQELALA